MLVNFSSSVVADFVRATIEGSHAAAGVPSFRDDRMPHILLFVFVVPFHRPSLTFFSHYPFFSFYQLVTFITRPATDNTAINAESPETPHCPAYLEVLDYPQ